MFFPVGDYTKPEVRMLAKKFGLPNAERKESQGICFVGKIDFEEFLKRYIPSNPGKIVDIKGNSLGEHEGVFYYTIGQRKGIGLAGGPYYVIDKDLTNNLLVASKEEKHLYKIEANVRDINWFVSPRDIPQHIETRLRYRQCPAASTIFLDSSGKKCIIRFNVPQRAVTPGQFAVFYQGEEMLAGGIIE